MNRTHNEPDVPALIGRAAAGDDEAADVLLSRVRSPVLRYCRARLGRGADDSYRTADDVAHEVCTAVLTALPRYRDFGRSFTAFVFGIAAHLVADARSTAAAPTDPSFLATLPAQQREVLVMRVVVGFSAEETGASLGMSSGAVRVAQHRALAKLRSQVTPAREKPA